MEHVQRKHQLFAQIAKISSSQGESDRVRGGEALVAITPQNAFSGCIIQMEKCLPASLCMPAKPDGVWS